MSISKEHISVKISDSRLRERNKVLSILFDLSNFLSTAQDLQGVLKGALEKVLDFFQMSAGRIYLLDDGGETLSLAAYQGIDSKGLETLRLSEGFSGKAARTRSFIAQDVAELEDENRRKVLSDKGLKAIICVPLMAMGQVVGVMNLASPSMPELDDAAIDLLITLGNQIAVAANNARLHEHLEEKIKALQEQKAAIEFFAYSISHDLKSPAIGIYGLTRRLSDKFCSALDDNGRAYCEQILKASEQVFRLVDRINGYIMSKEAPVHFAPMDLGEVLETIRNEFAQAMEQRAVIWREPEAMPAIVADKISMIRVFRNLVDNALKYGGPALQELRIGYEDSGDHHVLSVSDDGVALKVDDPDSLFQIFRRHHTSSGLEGAGLGLATVKEIAERHGGTVWVRSGEEKGTTFFLSISKNL